MYEILVVDDDATQLTMIEQLLDQEGYKVLKARTAKEALEVVERVAPSLCVIDVVLPQMDGVTLCRRLRENPQLANVPIIFLTAHHGSHSVAEALEAGGDDYVRKPFAMRELAARIRAHLRRSTNQLGSDIPTIRIMPNTHQVFINDREVELTRVEFDLLKHLCYQPDKWHTTNELLTHVWQYPRGVGDAALVRNHVRNLRRKLEDNPERPAIIQSRHGRGYVIRAYIQINGAEPVTPQL
jgi:two-component system alkaline phosphatase synthesis response regulator PhoP